MIGRIEFVNLSTSSSSPVAPHPAIAADAVTFDYRGQVLPRVRTFTSPIQCAHRRTSRRRESAPGVWTFSGSSLLNAPVCHRVAMLLKVAVDFSPLGTSPKSRLRRVATPDRRILFTQQRDTSRCMANTFTCLQYDVIFSTKPREPWLRRDLQERAWAYLGGVARANDLKALLIGGMEDHIPARTPPDEDVPGGIPGISGPPRHQV